MERTVQDVSLSCQSKLAEDKIAISYSLSNRAAREIYVLDVLPGYDAQAGKSVPNFAGLYLCWRRGPVAYVLKGIPPLPANKMVTVRIIPLATKLSAGEKLERTIELSLPLRERSPYYSPAKPDECEVTEVHSLILGVHFVRSTVEGFKAEPAPHGPEFFRVRSKNIIEQAETVEVEIATPALKLLKRKDLFSRI